jgi:hypothetical protein
MMLALHGRKVVGLGDHKEVSMPRILLFATMLPLVMWLALATPASAASSASVSSQGASASVRADFDNDGLADLAVGVTGEDTNGKTDNGGVNVIYGSAGGGLIAGGNQFWNQESTQGTHSIEDTAESDDDFGSSLAPR